MEYIFNNGNGKSTEVAQDRKYNVIYNEKIYKTQRVRNQNGNAAKISIRLSGSRKETVVNRKLHGFVQCIMTCVCMAIFCGYTCHCWAGVPVVRGCLSHNSTIGKMGSVGWRLQSPTMRCASFFAQHCAAHPAYMTELCTFRPPVATLKVLAALNGKN